MKKIILAIILISIVYGGCYSFYSFKNGSPSLRSESEKEVYEYLKMEGVANNIKSTKTTYSEKDGLFPQHVTYKDESHLVYIYIYSPYTKKVFLEGVYKNEGGTLEVVKQGKYSNT